MAGKTIHLKLRVWRQDGPEAKGHFDTFDAKDISTEASFLEMLDIVNEGLIKANKEPIVFDHDCREGICGMCGAVINGKAHGPREKTTLCQLHMRQFNDGDTLAIEPFRSKAFPVLKDLAIDRSALDRIIGAGGYISVNTGQAPESGAIPVPKPDAEAAMDAASCIGCGACVAACPNAAASLFTSAKIVHLGRLPQGHPERKTRVRAMAEQMKAEGFGSCSKHYECEAACPKGIKASTIAAMNWEYVKAVVSGEKP